MLWLDETTCNATVTFTLIHQPLKPLLLLPWSLFILSPYSRRGNHPNFSIHMLHIAHPDDLLTISVINDNHLLQFRAYRHFIYEDMFYRAQAFRLYQIAVCLSCHMLGLGASHRKGLCSLVQLSSDTIERLPFGRRLSVATTSCRRSCCSFY